MANAVTLAMICRDNAKTLPRLLDSLSREKAVQRVVAVDTGSEDDTVAVLRSYGIEPISFPWMDDFSLARNAALRAVDFGAWVLSLDSDEWVALGFGPALQAAIAVLEEAGLQADGVAVNVVSYSDSAGYANTLPIYAPRVFKNLPGTTWVFPVHEQTYRGGVAVNFHLDQRLVVHHDGYMASEMAVRNKTGRNLRMLRAAVEADPTQPWHRYNLGETLFSTGAFADAEDQYAKCVALAEAAGLDAAGMVVYSKMRLVNCLFLRGRLTEARELGQKLSQAHPLYAEGLCALAQVLMAFGEFYSAAALYDQAVAVGDEVRGGKAYPYVGDDSMRGWRAAILGGRSYAYAREYVRAVETYTDSATRLGSPVPDPLVESAACFAALGRVDLAQANLGEALAIWPGQERALAVRQLLEQEGRADGSLHASAAVGGVGAMVESSI